jgi:TolA-binding protein
VERSPLAGGAWTEEERALSELVLAYQARDCELVKERAPHYLTSSALRFERVTYMLGRCHYLDGAFESAARVLSRVSEQSPPLSRTDDALYYLGRAHYRAGQWAEAEGAWRRYLARFAHLGYADDAQYYLAKLKLRSGEPLEAHVLLEALLTLDGLSEARRAGVVYQLGKASHDLAKIAPPAQATARFEEARSWFERVLRDHPLSVYVDNARYQLALIFIDEGALEAALDALAQLLTDLPETPLAHFVVYRQGRVSEQLGRFEEAQGYYQSYEERFAGAAFHDNARYRRGRLSFEQAQALEAQGLTEARALYAEAELTLSSFLVDFQGSALTHRVAYYLGRARYARKSYDTALLAFALTLQTPESLYADNALYYTAKSLYQLARYEEARVEFVAFEERFPESVYLDDTLYFHARCWMREGDLSEAITLFERLITSLPASPYLDNAYARLVESWLTLERCDEALRSLTALEQLSPPSPLAQESRRSFESLCGVSP